MVPTKASCGASGSFLRTTGALTVAGSAATAEGGGRRDGEKIGRSRVADNWANGIAHKGLALCARSGAGPVGGATMRTVVTGGVGGAGTAGDPGACASSERTASRASLETADVVAPATSRDSDSNVMPMIKRRIIWLPAIALTPPAEVAAFRLRGRTRGVVTSPRVYL